VEEFLKKTSDFSNPFIHNFASPLHLASQFSPRSVKIDVSWGFALDSAGGAYSSQVWKLYTAFGWSFWS